MNYQKILDKFNKNFLPYEESMALKDLGFNEPGLFVYNHKNKLVQKSPTVTLLHCVNIDGGHGAKCIAPMWQQVFDWARIEYDLTVEIRTNWVSRPVKKVYTVQIRLEEEYGPKYLTGTVYGTYIDTYEEAILDCVRKIITILKNIEFKNGCSIINDNHLRVSKNNLEKFILAKNKLDASDKSLKNMLFLDSIQSEIDILEKEINIYTNRLDLRNTK